MTTTERKPLEDLHIAVPQPDGTERVGIVLGDGRKWTLARYTEQYEALTAEDADEVAALAALTGLLPAECLFMPEALARRIIDEYLPEWQRAIKMLEAPDVERITVSPTILGELPVVDVTKVDIASAVTFGQMLDIRSDAKAANGNEFRAMWSALATLMQPNYTGDAAQQERYLNAIGELPVAQAVELHAFFLSRLPELLKRSIARCGDAMQRLALLQSEQGKATTSNAGTGT